MNVMVYGASGSGKSEFAENMALKLEKNNLIYIAAMKPFGAEAERRIKRHRTLRDGKNFVTIEKYTCVSEILEAKDSTVLLECMSNLTANEMFDKDGCHKIGEDIVDYIVNQVEILAAKCNNLIIVTNDVFGSGTNYDEGTLEYMSVLGQVNIKLAKFCDAVYEVVYGISIALKEGI